jgi:hypothetical protein
MLRGSTLSFHFSQEVWVLLETPHIRMICPATVAARSLGWGCSLNRREEQRALIAETKVNLQQ